MNDNISVYIKNIDKSVTIKRGAKIYDLFQFLSDEDYIASKVNNEVTSLSFTIKINSTVEFLTIKNDFGMEVYRRSLAFLLSKVVSELLPERKLKIGHSLGPGYYFDLFGAALTANDLKLLKNAMNDEISAQKQIFRERISYEEAINYFKKNNREDKIKLLSGLNMSKLSIYRCDNFFELFDGPLASNTKVLKVFDLIQYGNGFILQFPKKSAPDKVAPFIEQKKIFEVYKETKDICKVLKVDNVGSLNEIIINNEIDNHIQIAENLQLKQIIKISDDIFTRREKVRLISIAGPSSSGKTTFSKKISLQLQSLGLKLITISIDNYFIDRDLTPLDDDGKPDYESLDALNLELLNENLSDLLQGKTVKLPIYNFFTGKSSISDREITLNQNEMIVIEGIHCLNDKLTSSINPKEKYKIYISALTQINLDDNNRIPTTDNRLLRRMVRDYKYRGHSAKKTFQMWPSVRNGEEKYIFPFQNNADGYLNTALDYELAVLKQFAEPLLMQIKPFDEEYSEAVRLQKFLSYIISAPTANVPSTSILREFIGGSFFEY
ncbi:MAG TPA: nucleoside kinase [Spirochaetota bacterium]|jgi:uridine kinase|nr:MAG: Threonine--tRNA ligase 2 [Spirochaetes bacterium ADurb.Bin133]HNZ26438.1 nucleoside kinase [Spirochaetota bacterium]HPY88062.1 nucleoside kinase [Spirochaetota bacterium]